MNELEPMLTTRQAARLLSCQTAAIRRYIATGTIRATRVGGRWLISPTVIASLHTPSLSNRTTIK